MLADLTDVAGGLPFTAGAATSLPYDRSIVSREDVLYHAFTYLYRNCHIPNSFLLLQYSIKQG